MSSTYAAAHGHAGSLTHGARPGIHPATSWFLVGFVSAAPPRELLCSFSVVPPPPSFSLRFLLHSLLLHITESVLPRVGSRLVPASPGGDFFIASVPGPAPPRDVTPLISCCLWGGGRMLADRCAQTFGLLPWVSLPLTSPSSPVFLLWSVPLLTHGSHRWVVLFFERPLFGPECKRAAVDGVWRCQGMWHGF